MSSRRSVCRGCGAEIVWVKTEAGKSMPCDPGAVPFWARPGAPGKVVTPLTVIGECDPDKTGTKVTFVSTSSFKRSATQRRSFFALSSSVFTFPRWDIKIIFALFSTKYLMVGRA